MTHFDIDERGDPDQLPLALVLDESGRPVDVPAEPALLAYDHQQQK